MWYLRRCSCYHLFLFQPSEVLGSGPEVIIELLSIFEEATMSCELLDVDGTSELDDIWRELVSILDDTATDDFNIDSELCVAFIKPVSELDDTTTIELSISELDILGSIIVVDIELSVISTVLSTTLEDSVTEDVSKVELYTKSIICDVAKELCVTPAESGSNPKDTSTIELPNVIAMNWELCVVSIKPTSAVDDALTNELSISELDIMDDISGVDKELGVISREFGATNELNKDVLLSVLCTDVVDKMSVAIDVVWGPGDTDGRLSLEKTVDEILLSFTSEVDEG